MRTRRAFKRTIGILAVLLILSAALNIALIIMLSKANHGGTDRGAYAHGAAHANGKAHGSTNSGAYRNGQAHADTNSETNGNGETHGNDKAHGETNQAS